MKVARIERDPRGLTSEVRGKIIDAMMDGELVPGDRLILDTLADQLGVSRTPVRDALLRPNRTRSAIGSSSSTSISIERTLAARVLRM